MATNTITAHKIHGAEYYDNKMKILILIGQLSLKVQEVQSEHPDQAAVMAARLAGLRCQLPAS